MAGRTFSWMCACMHTKSLQSCLTLCDPMNCSPPGSSVHGVSPGKNTGVGCHALFQEIFPTQGSNLCLLCLLRWRQAGSLPLALPGKPFSWIFLGYCGGSSVFRAIRCCVTSSYFLTDVNNISVLMLLVFRVHGHLLLLSLVVNVVHRLWILLSSCSVFISSFEKPKTASVVTAHPHPHSAHQKPHPPYVLDAFAHNSPTGWTQISLFCRRGESLKREVT